MPSTSRRVVAKVEFHYARPFPRVEFIVTNLETDRRQFYNKRSTAEIAAATRSGSSEPCCAGSPDCHHERDRRAANLSRFHRCGRQREEKYQTSGPERWQLWALGFPGKVKLTPSVVPGSNQR